MSFSATMSRARSIIYVGMDVHKESLTLALLPAAVTMPARIDKLPNNLVKLKRWLERAACEGELRVWRRVVPRRSREHARKALWGQSSRMDPRR